jgi:hypothetical protein
VKLTRYYSITKSLKKKLEILKIRFSLVQKYPLTSLLPACILPENYRLDMVDPQEKCPLCGSNVHIQWTTRVYPISLQIGKPELVLHLKNCSACSFTVYPKDYSKLSPKYSSYSYDIMAKIGLLRLKNLGDIEIVNEIKKKYFIEVPKSTVSFLANSFYDYFASTHYKLNADKIRDYIEKRGGYVMHIDGTCEDDSDIIFSMIDGVSKIVLASTKMKGENKKDVTSFLVNSIKMFGQPLAVVSDLSKNIINAVNETVSEDVPQYICQFHFLENMGRAIFKAEYSRLLKFISSEKIRGQMQSLRKDLGTKHADRLLSQDEFVALLENPKLINKNKKTETRRSLAFSLLKWIIDYKSGLNGEYFPFSRPGYELVVRCKKVFEILERLFKEKKKKGKKYNCRTLNTIYEKLKLFFDNNKVEECIEQIKRQTAVFNDVREYLRMEAEKGKPLIRQKTDSAETSYRSVSYEIFIAEIREKYKHDLKYCKIINTVEKYFNEYKNYLSGHSILNKNNEYININRTNNVMEHFFGDFKHNLRKRVGNAGLKRYIHFMHPEAQLAQNLLNEEYLSIIGGCDLGTICKMFAASEEDAKKRAGNRREFSNRPSHIPFKILRSGAFLNNVRHTLSYVFGILFQTG